MSCRGGVGWGGSCRNGVGCEIKLIGFQKFTNGFEGMCMSRGKFLKP